MLRSDKIQASADTQAAFAGAVIVAAFLLTKILHAQRPLPR
jgi:hypothetical protein